MGGMLGIGDGTAADDQSPHQNFLNSPRPPPPPLFLPISSALICCCKFFTCCSFSFLARSMAALAAFELALNLSGDSSTRETSPERTVMARTTRSRPTPRVLQRSLPKVAEHMTTTSPSLMSPRLASSAALEPSTISSMTTEFAGPVASTRPRGFLMVTLRSPTPASRRERSTLKSIVGVGAHARVACTRESWGLPAHASAVTTGRSSIAD
mmetsp:Transcript_26274/g.77086  ORF Transcript_26274/g.77086 Transcript_26274/m.77086 type:complete len:211 (+) Transcript_26274:317-949(+)